MRLFIKDSVSGEKTYIKTTARTRKELAEKFGSNRIKVKDKIYSVNVVQAEPDQNTAPAMALGGVLGVVGGVPGVVIGGIIGGLLGKSSDDDDEKRAKEFNRSMHVS